MHTPRILVVEDSVVQFAILNAGLISQNWGCVHAANFVEALAMVQSEHSFGCILSDVSLPGMGFEEFLDNLARLKLKIPLIIYTANISVQSVSASPRPSRSILQFP